MIRLFLFYIFCQFLLAGKNKLRLIIFVIFPSFSSVLISFSGVHILQLISSCEIDEETENVNAALEYGYDKEDLIALDFNTLTWIALKPEAIPFKRVWDTEKERNLFDQKILMQMCPEWLKTILNTGKNFLLRTEHPSLSLLQKTPSSPVSCHATGFYPKSALMFWKKDGEEIHEHVEHGEILPNNDGTFQMTVYLNISSISLDDWKRYVCVFKFLDKEEENIQLDEAEIKTNRGKEAKCVPVASCVFGLSSSLG
uniref:Ig-like domain-containing protein n=1 Tax=Cyprinodon variegatus TaxID=28743 RepID=A0A3Q2CMX7_CYPVA